MAFKIQDLLIGGVVNCFKLEGSNDYVLVLAFKDKGFVVPLLTVPKKGQIAFIDPSISMEENLNIQDFMKTGFPTAYKKLPQFNFCMSAAAPAHNMKVEAFVPLSCKGNKAEDKLLQKYLTDAGYDVSALNKTIKASTKERDYTAVRATPEGTQRYDDVGAIMKKIDGDIKKCDPEVKIAFEAIKQGKTNGLILTGPAGTGKSVAAYIMSYTMGAPLITYQASEGMQIEDMVGQYKPSDDPGKQFEFCLGLLLQAYSQGFQMLIDEVNTAPAGILSIINQFMDDTPTITYNGVIYRRNPNFVLYMTLNPGYEGTQIMNQALKSRFMKVVIKNLSLEDFIFRMVTYSKNRCGCALSEEFYKALYEFQPTISTQANNCGESVAICIRNAQQLTDAITTHSMTEEEFVASVNMAYTNNIYMDNDNLKNLEDFKKTDEFKNNVKKLFSLYNYRVLESIAVELDYDAAVDEPAEVANKSTRVVDDFDDDDFDALDGMDEDDVAKELAKEIDEDAEEDSETEKEEESKEESEDEDFDDLDDEDESNNE